MAVVDASVVVDWVAPGLDDDSPALDLLDGLASTGESLLAPRLLEYEVANALVSGIRRRRWSGREADSAFTRLRRLPVRYLDTDMASERAWELSRRYDQHPVYDMVYLATAELHGQVYYTADRVLAERVLGLDYVHLIAPPPE